MKSIVTVCVLLSCGLSACSKQSNESLPLSVTRSFEEAMASNDPAKIAALFTQDAEFLAQESPTVKGRQNIQDYLTGQLNPIVVFDTTTEMSLTGGNLAVDTGVYTFRDTRRGEDVETGKYLHVWKKEKDEWKIYRAMFNTDRPTTSRVLTQEAR